jgi:hypothetical protein
MCNQLEVDVPVDVQCCSWRTLKKNFHSLVMRALGQVTPVSAAFSSAPVVNQVCSLQGRASSGVFHSE